MDSRDENYCHAVVSWLKLEVASPNIPASRVGVVVLLMKPLVSTLLEWVNEKIRTDGGTRVRVSHAAFHRLLGVSLFSQSSGMSQESTIALFSKLRFQTPVPRWCSEIGNTLIPFHQTLRITEACGTWRSQRDATQLLNDFERQAWSVSKRLFYVLLVQLITLDDDLMGTRSRDNQVKMLSDRNADREGHSTDNVADALFRLTDVSRFRRCGEPQVTNVSRLLTSLMESHRELTQRGVILTADRGFGLRSILSRSTD